MTQGRDFDRIAQAWLSVGPNEAPDRAVAAVLDALATTPQVRRPWRGPIWRQIHMSPRTFAVVGTLVLAVVIGSSLLLKEQANVAHPSPSPSVVPSDVFPSLVGPWAGAPHTLTGIAQGSIVRASFHEDGLWQISGASVPAALNSHVVVTGPDRMTMTAIDTKTCHTGDVGTYRIALSPGKKRLTISSENDPCAARSIVVSGDWIRNECMTGPAIAGGDFDCYGDLEPGTYPSREVDLRHEIGHGQTTTFGALTFTVPAGWSHVADNATRFWLMKSDGYAHLNDPDLKDESIYVFGHPQASSQEKGCPSAPQDGVGLTAGAIMAAITSRAAFTATTPRTITINGRSGLWTDLRLDPSWKQSCDFRDDGSPVAPILYANTGLSAVDATARERLVLLDIGHGDTVAIEIFAADPPDWDSYVAEAMRIVESMQFAEPVASN
jgi:hypothetical protein